VRHPKGIIVGAQVIARRMSDKEPWPFPMTNDWGVTKREIPDGVYLLSVNADGYEPRLIKIRVPTQDKFPTRMYHVTLEAK
jgi:hypothetical protein